jgi:hypothetical protein
MTTFSVSPIATDEWVHIAATRSLDPAGVSLLRVYVNGVLESELEHPNVAPLDASATLTIGGNAIDNRLFTGEVDDVRIYNTALTSEEIGEIAGIDTSCPAEGDADFGDTHCAGFTVAGGPPGGGSGTYTVTAMATDDSGDAVLYRFEANNGVFQVIAGPQASPEGELSLIPGTWTITVTVDDTLGCDDVAGDASCSEEFVVEEAVPQLVSHWTFDETLEDEVGDNHGVFAGDVEPTFVEGFDGTAGGAILFDGIDDAVTVNRVVQDEMTLAAWIRAEISQRNDGAQYYQGSGLIYADVPGGANDFGMSVNGDFVGFGIGNPDMTVLSVTPVITEDWVHVAATRTIDAAGVSVLRVYIDGEFDSELEHANIEPLTASEIITIGGNAIDSRFFTGEIDDVRIYNVALSDEEIQEVLDPSEPTGGFRRGDADGNGVIDITDAISSLAFQFLGTFQPPCLDSLDWDDSGAIDLSDPIGGLTFQFLGGAAPPAPGLTCGEDPTADGLGCASYPQGSCDA